jgi:Na+/proline symporter
VPLGLVAIAVYIVALAWVVWRGRALSRTADMFNMFGRRADLVRASAGYLSLIGAGELVTLAQLGYDSGLSLLWFPGGIAAGFLVLALFGDRVRRRAAEVGAESFVDLVRAEYGGAAALGLMLTYLLALGSLLLLQFAVGGQLLQITTGLPAVAAPAVIALVIIGYLLVGGYVSVLSTDVLRLLFLAICAGVLAIVAAWQAPQLSALAFAPRMAVADGLTLFVLGVFGAVCAGDVWQTVLASSSKSVLQRSMIVAGACFLLFGLAIGMLGIATKTVAPTLPDGQSALVAAARIVVPGALSPVLALMIVGSVMATADTEIWVIGLSAVSLITAGASGGDREQRVRRAMRMAIPLVAIIALGCSYLAGRAEAVYEGLLVLLTSLAPPILGVLFLHRTRFAVTWSIWVAFGATLWLLIRHAWTVPPALTFAPVLAATVAYGLGIVADRLMPVLARERG